MSTQNNFSGSFEPAGVHDDREKVLVYEDGFSLEIHSSLPLLSARRGRGREIAEFEGYTTLPNFSATGKKVENETTNVYLSLKGFFLSVYKETEI